MRIGRLNQSPPMAMMRPVNERRSHIAGLDGLRAAACLAVFGVHFHQITHLGGQFGPIDLETLFENGNTGVALFFLLSGLLLGLPMWNPDRRFSLPQYALHRAVRILPAYYICLTAIVLHQAHFHTPRELADTVLHYVFLHNFAEFSIYSLNTPFWTIAVQVQFYLLFPLLLVLLRPFRRSPAVMVILLLGAAVGCYFAHRAVMLHYQPREQDYVLSHSLLAHLPVFLLGWATGVMLYRSPAQKDEVEKDSAAAGLGCDALFWLSAVLLILLLGVPEWDEWLSIPFGRYNLPYAPALLAVMVVCGPRAMVARRVLEWAPLRLLGVISYGVYLYHLPCMRAVSHVMQGRGLSVERDWLMFAGASFIVTLVVSVASYLIVERPVLRWAKGRGK